MSAGAQLEIQFWDSKTKSYIRDSRTPGKLYEGEGFFGKRRAFARGIAGGRPWRIARADRALKPRYVVPRCRASDRTREQVIETYLAWAIETKAPSVTLYKNTYYPFTARIFGSTRIRYISPEEHFSVTEETLGRPHRMADQRDVAF